MKINNVVTNDSNIIANGFNNYYANITSTVINNLPASNFNYDYFLAPRENGRINWALTNDFEVKRVVNKLNNVKPGPDKILSDKT